MKPTQPFHSRKSRRERIIPIAVEGEGFVTPPVTEAPPTARTFQRQGSAQSTLGYVRQRGSLAWLQCGWKRDTFIGDGGRGAKYFAPENEDRGTDVLLPPNDFRVKGSNPVCPQTKFALLVAICDELVLSPLRTPLASSLLRHRCVLATWLHLSTCG